MLALIIAASLTAPPSVSQWKEDVADRYFDRLSVDDLLVERRLLLEARPPEGKAWAWLIPGGLTGIGAGAGVMFAGVALAFGSSDWATPVWAMGVGLGVASLIAIAFSIYKLASEASTRDEVDRQVKRIDVRLGELQVPSTTGAPAGN